MELSEAIEKHNIAVDVVSNYLKEDRYKVQKIADTVETMQDYVAKDLYRYVKTFQEKYLALKSIESPPKDNGIVVPTWQYPEIPSENFLRKIVYSSVEFLSESSEEMNYIDQTEIRSFVRSILEQQEDDFDEAFRIFNRVALARKIGRYGDLMFVPAECSHNEEYKVKVVGGTYLNIAAFQRFGGQFIAFVNFDDPSKTKIVRAKSITNYINAVPGLNVKTPGVKKYHNFKTLENFCYISDLKMYYFNSVLLNTDVNIENRMSLTMAYFIKKLPRSAHI